MRTERIERSRLKTNQALQGVLILSVIAAAIFILLGHQANAEPRHGGTLRITNELEGAGFDVIKARAMPGSCMLAANLVMERLFDFGEDGELIPVLGLSAASSEDGKTWTITLRRGVTFHDGAPFNAQAVIDHWRRVLDPENRFRGRLLLGPIQSVEIAGDYKARFRLKHAWKPFLAALAEVRGFSGLIPSPKAVEEDAQNHAPVGTGPFIFKEWKTSDRIVVVKNPDYWRKGLPYLDKIVFRHMPSHEARYNALLSGQVDIMFMDRPNQLKKMEENPDYTAYPIDVPGAALLALNNSKPPLDDVRVRRALAHAWDQEKYIKSSAKGIVPYTEHWFGDTLTCDDAGYLNHDVKKARALLADYGNPVELEYVHSATVRGREAAQIVQQMMKEVGVKVNATPHDFSGIMKKVFGKKYDISSWLIPDARDMDPFTEATLHSGSPWNIFRYSDEETDKLLRDLRLGVDPDVLAAKRCAIVKRVNSRAPFLYLYGRRFYMIAKNNVENIKNQNHYLSIFADLWLEPEEK